MAGSSSEPIWLKTTGWTWPMLRILLEHFRYQVFEFKTEFFELRRKNRLLSHYVFDGLVWIYRFKRSPPAKEFEEKNSRCPNIYSLSIPPRKHLRSSVIQSASNGPHIKKLSSLPEPSTHPKINKLDLFSPLIIKNILRLDIPMCDIMFMQVA